MAHMRSCALGRIQVASELRARADDQLTSAIRSARSAGASLEVLRIESGLAPAEIRRVLRINRKKAAA